MRRPLAALALCVILSSALAAGRAPARIAGPGAIRVEPARTRIALASVHLELGDLKLHGRDLVGRFEVHVPLFPSMDDHGTVSLRAEMPLEEALREGAQFTGTATSQLTGEVKPVDCTVEPDGTVRIAVKTSKRTLRFDSRYTILATR